MLAEAAAIGTGGGGDDGEDGDGEDGEDGDDGDGDDGDDGDDGLKSEREALCLRVKVARDNLKASSTPGAARELLAATAALTVNKYRLVGLPKRAAEQVQSVKGQSRSRKYSGEWTYTFSTKFCTSAPFRDLAGANAVVDLAPSHYWPQVPTPCVFCAEGFKQEVICKGWTLPAAHCGSCCDFGQGARNWAGVAGWQGQQGGRRCAGGGGGIYAAAGCGLACCHEPHPRVCAKQCGATSCAAVWCSPGFSPCRHGHGPATRSSRCGSRLELPACAGATGSTAAASTSCSSGSSNSSCDREY